MPKAPYYTSPLWQKPLRWGDAAIIYACAKGPPPLSPFDVGWWDGWTGKAADECPYKIGDHAALYWLFGWSEGDAMRAEEPPEEDDPS